MKWIEDRTENLISTGFARDFHMHGEMALKADGTMLGLRTSLLADEGAFHADAQPSKFKVGLFHIVTGSYDLPAAHVEADGYYTNKAPGGVAYRCSFRVTEASYLIERLVQNAAYELGMDPADIRKKNFIDKDQFPYESVTGFVYDSGDYHAAMDLALEKIDYAGLREEQKRERADGKLWGIGLASFTEVVGAGPHKDYDIIGLKMNDGAELRIHPTGKAILKISSMTQGQGHETTFAQIVAEELGIQPEDIKVMHGDTDNTPYGLGTYASRSTPVVRRGDRDGRPPRRREGAEDRRAPARGRARRTSSSTARTTRCRARPTGRSRSRTSRSPRTRTSPTAWRPASRATTTTTRRT